MTKLVSSITSPFRNVYSRFKRFITDLERETRATRVTEGSVGDLQARGAATPENICVYAVGDVHGRADLLKRLYTIVKKDAELLPESHRKVIVFLGDYVDRGFQSKQVIDFLLSENMEGFEVRFLKGNHEAALLEFLKDPGFGPQWAKFGGAETVISYGVRPPRSRTATTEWGEVCEKLNTALPNEHRAFLQQLELSIVIGDYVFVHAGMRPGRPLEEQSEDDLLWIRETFLSDNSDFEQVVVHGHTPISTPYADRRRIAVDTGAYLSGKLTAVKLIGTHVEFLST